MTAQERVLDQLHKMRSRIATARGRVDDLQSKREAIVRRGRELDPPVTWPAMAKVAGVTEDALHKMDRKAREREGAEPVEQ